MDGEEKGESDGRGWLSCAVYWGSKVPRFDEFYKSSISLVARDLSTKSYNVFYI